MTEIRKLRQRGSNRGGKKGGGVMKGGGSDSGERVWWRVREVRSEEEQELTHQGSSSLVSAHECWLSLSGCSSLFTCG